MTLSAAGSQVTSPIASVSMPETLVADSVSKTYGEHSVLRECSLSLAAGQCFLLQGPSGGGKSTLLRILALLEAPDSGTVVHGLSAYPAGAALPASPFPFLTVVFQQLFLWPNLTMAQNVALVLRHRPDEAMPPAAMSMLDRFSITPLLDRLPHQCSLGERQRLAIVRALLSDARFILLDEPSSALDSGNKAILLAELAAAKAAGRGLLVITHDDRAFDTLADRTFDLEDARLRPR